MSLCLTDDEVCYPSIGRMHGDETVGFLANKIERNNLSSMKVSLLPRGLLLIENKMDWSGEVATGFWHSCGSSEWDLSDHHTYMYQG